MKLVLIFTMLISLNSFAQTSIADQAWDDIVKSETSNIGNMNSQLEILKKHMSVLKKCSIDSYNLSVNEGPSFGMVGLTCSFSDNSKISISLDEEKLKENFVPLFDDIMSILRLNKMPNDVFKETISARQFKKILKLPIFEGMTGLVANIDFPINGVLSETVQVSIWKSNL